MAAHSTRSRRSHQIETLQNQFAQSEDLPFANLLPAERIERAVREEKAGWSERVYTPIVTLWAFLSQVITADSSCRKTVARVLAWLVAQGRPPCSPKTDPYCKARQRLPESLLVRLTRETGQDLHDRADGVHGGSRSRGDGRATWLSHSSSHRANNARRCRRRHRRGAG